MEILLLSAHAYMHNMHEQTTKELVYALGTGNTWIGINTLS